MRLATAALVLLGSLLIAGAAAAQAQLISASRLVSASMDGVAYCQTPDNFFCPGGAPPLSAPSDSASTAGLGDFDERASTSFSFGEQTSSFSPLVLTGSGRALASGSYVDEYAFSNYFYFVMTSTARSDLLATFDVDEPTPYRFEAWMSGTAVDRDCNGVLFRTSSSCVDTLHDSFLSHSVTLSRDGTTLAELTWPEPGITPQSPDSVETSSYGMLPPGRYTIEADVRAHGQVLYTDEFGDFPYGETMSEVSYEFTLGLGPASAVPALGVLGRSVVALLLPASALVALGRRSRARAAALA